MSVSADGAARLQRIRQALEPVLKLRRRGALRPWLEAAWIRVGGAACLQTEAERADAAAYLDLLEEFEEGGDIPEFDRLELRLRDLFTKPDPAADERVQVMTIHQAKGLEFDTVILPGLGKPPKRDESRLLMWSNHGGRVLLAPASNDEDPIYKFLERHERAKDRHESRRLLYVGATRARERLHLIGHAKQAKDGPRAAPGSLLELLWPVVQPGMFVPVSPPQPMRAAVRPLPRLAVDFQSSWAAMNSSTALDEPAPFNWLGDTQRHAGVIVHRFIQRIAKEGLVNWPAARVGAHSREIEAALAALGVPSGDLDSSVERVCEALTGMLEDDAGRWTLSPFAGAESEVGLTAVLDSRTVHVVVDRTFVDDDGTRWIIDYKTAVDDDVEPYRAQLALYERVMRLREPARVVRSGLYFPLLKQWRVVVP